MSCLVSDEANKKNSNAMKKKLHGSVLDEGFEAQLRWLLK